MILRCVGCGRLFKGRSNATRCVKDCGRTSLKRNESHALKRLSHDMQFIGVDGEGITTVKRVEVYDSDSQQMVYAKRKVHDYVLLSVGDKSLHKNGEMLTHEDIFPFLWEQYQETPNAAFVGFFLGYDFTHWFRSLPFMRAWKLLHKDGIRSRMRRDSDMPRPWPVRAGDWEFDVLANKRFMIRPYVAKEHRAMHVVNHKDGTTTLEPVARPWMYICDTGPFFQTSFLTAINPKDWQHPIVSDSEYATILEGKARRADAAFDTAMIKYNVLENAVLSRVMETVNAGLVTDNIRLAKQQWFGPGQAAQKWLALVGCPSGEEIRETVPQWARDAARESYYGGWFEVFAHGLISGESYGYDINSAYPFGISRLPCLMHGVWTRGTSPLKAMAKGSLRLAYVSVTGRNKLVGTMPFRRPDGSIARFKRQSGWYWWDEIQAAKRAGLISSIKVHQWIEYKPCNCPPPLADIKQLYEGRLSVGKNSPSGKGKKLIYNSAYGKLAQSIGQPKFTNPIYASRITAMCRIQILDAIATHPTKTDSLLMVATDSVVFKEPHPTLDIDETRLGAWDVTEHVNLSLFMPGMYWDDTTRERIALGESPKLKSRGVPALDLARWVTKIDAHWADLLTRKDGWRWPKVRLPVNFQMVTAKQAVVRDAWPTCGKVTTDGYRELTANPESKRVADYPYPDSKYGFIRTMAYDHDTLPNGTANYVTTSYEKAFGELPEDREANTADIPITPDGDIVGLLSQALIP